MAAKKSEPVKDTRDTIIDPFKSQNVLLGCAVVLILVLLFGGGLIFFLVQNRDFKLDDSLKSPTLSNLPERTNKESITVKGSAREDSNIGLFIDGEDSGKRVKTRGNGKFEFNDVELKDEKTYKFKVAEIETDLFSKERSKFSNVEVIEVDREDPSRSVSFTETPETTGEKTIDIKGKTKEPNATVELRKNGQKYTAKTDKDGNFVIEDVELNEGKNTFNVFITDNAGNEVLAREKVIVTYDAGDIDGSIDGPGATDEDLPDSAGELDAVVAMLQSNVLVVVLMLGLLGAAVVAQSKSLLGEKE